MTTREEYEHRFKWLVSYHLYAVEIERRFETEAEARIAYEDTLVLFKQLLSSAYNDKIKLFTVRCGPIESKKNKAKYGG